jgi:hypothetical protein
VNNPLILACRTDKLEGKDEEAQSEQNTLLTNKIDELANQIKELLESNEQYKKIIVQKDVFLTNY